MRNHEIKASYGAEIYSEDDYICVKQNSINPDANPVILKFRTHEIPELILKLEEFKREIENDHPF